MTTSESYTPPPGHERFIPDLVSRIDPKDRSTLGFSMSTYQVFDEEAATAVLAYDDGEMGFIMWNLMPGQENDYHLHPQTEHLHIVIQGEVEYSLEGEEPVLLGVGQAMMVPAGIPHGIRNLSERPASYLAVATTGKSYEKILVDRP